jgi:hypothetical protein
MPFTPPLLRDWCAEVDADPSPEWLVEDLILSDAAVLMSGAPTRSFKSWLAFQLALTVATGKPQGQLRPGKELEGVGAGVLILEFEGPRKSTRNRFRMLENSNNMRVDDVENLWFSHREERYLDDPQDIEDITRFVARNNIKLVILDTFAKCSRGDENSAKDTSRTMHGLDKLRNAGAACVYIHHTRKPPMNAATQDVDDEIRGSSALAGFYDVHLALRRRREEQAHIDLTVRSNEAEEKYFTVQWHIDGEADTALLDLRRVDEVGELTDSFCEERIAQVLDTTKTYGKAALMRHWPDLDRHTGNEVLKRLIKMQRLSMDGGKYKVIPKESGKEENGDLFHNRIRGLFEPQHEMM